MKRGRDDEDDGNAGPAQPADDNPGLGPEEFAAATQRWIDEISSSRHGGDLRSEQHNNWSSEESDSADDADGVPPPSPGTPAGSPPPSPPPTDAAPPNADAAPRA